MNTRRLRIAGELPLATEALTKDLLQAARAAGLPAGARVDIEIPIAPVQRRHLKDLPPGRLTEVRELVRHQAARFFRTGPAGLAIDVAKHPGGKGHVAVAVDLVVARAVLDAAAAAGLRVRGLVPPADGTAPRLSLLPPEVVLLRQTIAWRRTGWMAAATGAIAVLLLTATWIQVNREASLVEAAASRLRPVTTRIQDVRRQLDSAAGMVRTVHDSRRAHQAVLDRLALVARSLPDSAALSAFTFPLDGDVEFGGVALEPLEVLARVQRSPELADARLEVTHAADPSSGRSWRHFRVRTGGPHD